VGCIPCSQSVLCGHSKTWRPIITHKALCSLTTTRAWEASVLCGHSRTWQPTSTHKALYLPSTSRAWGASVLNDHSKAWWSTIAQDVSCQPHPWAVYCRKHTGRQVSSYFQRTSLFISLTLGINTWPLTQKQIPMNGAPTTDKSKVELTLHLPSDTQCRTTIISLTGGVIHLPHERKQRGNHHIW